MAHSDERYDIIGDLHGHAPTLRLLADRLGYGPDWKHPQGRRLVFVGDLSDRGPDNAGALRLVMDLVRQGLAYNVLGNHDDALRRWLSGEQIPLLGGIDETINELREQPDAKKLKENLLRFLTNTPLVLTLDEGKLIIVHAGLEDAMIGEPITAETRRFLLNGDVIGTSPEGKTLRRDWAADYHGEAFIAYGHTPQPEAILASE